MAEERTCPVDGCLEALPGADAILCDRHWMGLPESERHLVMDARVRWRTSGNARWRRLTYNAFILACNNAIKAAGRKPEDPADQPA